MPRLATRWLLGWLVAFAAGAGPAWAAPLNDDFRGAVALGTGGVLGPAPAQDSRETGDATVQADLFSPGGVGGGPEPNRCGTTTFGKTIWYRFEPDRVGVLETR